MEQSIASFAEQLLTEDLEKIEAGTKPAPVEGITQDPEQRDITNIEVPKSFMSAVLNEEVSESEAPSLTPKELINEPDETSLEDMALRLHELINEAQLLLKEMTTVGALGVNLSGGTKKRKKKKKKNNPWAICHSSTGKKKSAKFERCVKAIKRQHGLK
tara:strand:+ start:762 stop:1238 length:477 start_codon:yes stop_codon:yes gene_type:complete